MIENHQVNLFNSKYNPTKGILQFTVLFDHPVDTSSDKWRNQFGHNWFRARALVHYYQEIVSLSVG